MGHLRMDPQEVTTTTKQPEIGDAIVFRDPKGEEHDALVQFVHNPSLLNLVFISSDPARGDNYGRQVEHATSVGLWQMTSANGFYWRYRDQTKAANVSWKPEGGFEIAF